MIRLTVKDGSILQTLTVEGDKVFIGRLPSNSVKLDHSSVSRKHCLLRRTPSGGLELLDLNSRRGTMKNGKSVERAALAAGDEIRVGEVSVTVEHLDGAPARVHGGEYTLAPSEEKSEDTQGGDGKKEPTAATAKTPAAKPRHSSPTPTGRPSANSSSCSSGVPRPGPDRSSFMC